MLASHLQYLFYENSSEILQVVQTLQDAQRIELLSRMDGQKSLRAIIQGTNDLSLRMGYYHMSYLTGMRFVETQYVYQEAGIMKEIIPRVLYANLLLRLTEKLSPEREARIVRVNDKTVCFLLNTANSICGTCTILAHSKRLQILENLSTKEWTEASELASRVQLSRKQLGKILLSLKGLPFVMEQDGSTYKLVSKNLWIQLPLPNIARNEINLVER